MTSGLTLIHLVSEQSLPNLLPLLALRPERVIQICSNQTRFIESAKFLEHAAREAGISADFRIEKLSSSSPDPDEVRHALKQLLSVFPAAAVNITGGTKLMSLGAYLGASEFSIPIVYCDTQAKQFQQVGSVHLPAGMKPFNEVASSLTLRTVMAAHGKSPADWRYDTAEPPHLKFGATAWALRTEHADAFNSCRMGNHLRNFFRCDKGKIPRSVGKLRALAVADIISAIPGELPPPIIDFFQSATDAGFLMRLDSGGYQLAPGPDQAERLRSHIERIANLLDGSWLELSVLSFLSTSHRHLDPHWSVEPTAAGAEHSEYGETDLVAIDAAASSLEVISCKTALSQPLEHLEGLRTRANNLGGSHALATLAVLHTQEEKKLHRWGKLLRVKVLIGQEIPRHFTNHRRDP